MPKTACGLIENIASENEFIEVTAKSASVLQDDFWAIAKDRCKRKRKDARKSCMEGECDANFSCVDKIVATEPSASFPDRPNVDGKFRYTWEGKLICGCTCEATKTG